jgi:predicted permease
MRTLRAIAVRFIGLFRTRRADAALDADFNAELDSHIAIATDEGIRSGLIPTEARRQALIRLGGAEQTRQAHRERRILPWIENVARELRYSLRSLAKHRSTTTIAILSIGLGIGANATIFSMVNRFILRPPPMGDPSNLLAIFTFHEGDQCCNDFPYPVYTDVRDQAQSFSGVAAYFELLPASISGSGEPERVWGQAVTSNFFGVTQLPMVLGRGFVDSEENAPAVVLGAGLWQRRFNSDPAIIGKPITLSGHSMTVVGVVTPTFHSVDQILNTEFWVPLGYAPLLVPNLPKESPRDQHWLQVVARLKPGVSRNQAAAELRTLAQRFAQTNPATDKGNGFVFEQAGSLQPRETKTVLIFLAALSVVVLLVLAIAAANVANLLFAQAAAHQREMAVRLALGATRATLRRKVITESLLLGIGGGAVGVLLSLWATRALSSFHLPAPVPLDIAVGVDWRVLLFAFALSVVSGVLLGLAPAWTASHPLLANALKGEDALARPGRRFTLRNILVVAQIAMSVILLCVTGLFLRSLQSASTIDIGFRTDNILMMSVDPSVHGYTPARTVDFMMQLQQRAAARPGVVSAVATDVAPLSGGGRADGFWIPATPNNPGYSVNTTLFMVTPGYFDTLGIHRIAGNDFGAETATGPKVAIVNEEFVRRVLQGKYPIGQQVKGGGVTYQIIGVVGNTKSRTLGEDTSPVLFRSLQQSVAGDPSFAGYTLIVHTGGNPTALAKAVHDQIHSLDPNMAIYRETTMQEHMQSAYFLPHLAASLFGTFGFIGLVLAAIGLYGVMSYSVSRRTREIGIRMAMGAQPGTVERLVLRQGMVLTLIALVFGWPAAWLLAKMASSFLYGIQPHDLLTFTLVPPLLFAIAMLACWLPARGAASIDPMQALRTE